MVCSPCDNPASSPAALSIVIMTAPFHLKIKSASSLRIYIPYFLLSGIFISNIPLPSPCSTQFPQEIFTSQLVYFITINFLFWFCYFGIVLGIKRRVLYNKIKSCLVSQLIVLKIIVIFLIILLTVVIILMSHSHYVALSCLTLNCLCRSGCLKSHLSLPSKGWE